MTEEVLEKQNIEIKNEDDIVFGYQVQSSEKKTELPGNGHSDQDQVIVMDEKLEEGIHVINPQYIDNSRIQPRIKTTVDEKLLDSIEEYGSSHETGNYVPVLLIYIDDLLVTVLGHRRVEACKTFEYKILGEVRNLSEEEAWKIALGDFNREDLDLLSEIRSYYLSSSKYGMKDSEIAILRGDNRKNVSACRRIYEYVEAGDVAHSTLEEFIGSGFGISHIRQLVKLCGSHIGLGIITVMELKLIADDTKILVDFIQDIHYFHEKGLYHNYSKTSTKVSDLIQHEGNTKRFYNQFGVSFELDICSDLDVDHLKKLYDNKDIYNDLKTYREKHQFLLEQDKVETVSMASMRRKIAKIADNIQKLKVFDDPEWEQAFEAKKNAYQIENMKQLNSLYQEIRAIEIEVQQTYGNHLCSHCQKFYPREKVWTYHVNGDVDTKYNICLDCPKTIDLKESKCVDCKELKELTSFNVEGNLSVNEDGDQLSGTCSSCLDTSDEMAKAVRDFFVDDECGVNGCDKRAVADIQIHDESYGKMCVKHISNWKRKDGSDTMEFSFPCKGCASDITQETVIVLDGNIQCQVCKELQVETEEYTGEEKLEAKQYNVPTLLKQIIDEEDVRAYQTLKTLSFERSETEIECDVLVKCAWCERKHECELASDHHEEINVELHTAYCTAEKQWVSSKSKSIVNDLTFEGKSEEVLEEIKKNGDQIKEKVNKTNSLKDLLPQEEKTEVKRCLVCNLPASEHEFKGDFHHYYLCNDCFESKDKISNSGPHDKKSLIKARNFIRAIQGIRIVRSGSYILGYDIHTRIGKTYADVQLYDKGKDIAKFRILEEDLDEIYDLDVELEKMLDWSCTECEKCFNKDQMLQQLDNEAQTGLCFHCVYKRDRDNELQQVTHNIEMEKELQLDTHVIEHGDGVHTLDLAQFEQDYNSFVSSFQSEVIVKIKPLIDKVVNSIELFREYSYSTLEYYKSKKRLLKLSTGSYPSSVTRSESFVVYTINPQLKLEANKKSSLLNYGDKAMKSAFGIVFVLILVPHSEGKKVIMVPRLLLEHIDDPYGRYVPSEAEFFSLSSEEEQSTLDGF